MMFSSEEVYIREIIIAYIVYKILSQYKREVISMLLLV